MKKNNTPKEDSLELQRLEIEREKLRIERFKAWWTGFSILIPLLITAGTLLFNVQNQRAQARLDFKLKAAEILISSPSPTEARNKAAAMAKLFSEELPVNFGENFIPAEYGAPKISDSKKFLLTLIVEHPEQRNDIIEMWLKLSPSDTWAADLHQ